MVLPEKAYWPVLPLDRRLARLAREELRQITAVAWEGGGFLGQAYLPIYRALEHCGARITHHAGTSAGAITALVGALGYKGRHLEEILASTDWAKWTSYRPPACLRLLRTGGWYRLDAARGWLERLVADATGLPNITMAELARVMGRELFVVVVRYRALGQLKKATPWVIGPSDGVRVVDAVLASMAVPLVWPPVRVGAWWCADGGSAINHPLEVIANLPLEQILGVRLDTDTDLLDDPDHWGEQPTTGLPWRPSLRGVIGTHLSMLLRRSNRSHLPERIWERVVHINCRAERALDLRSTPVRVAALRAAGRAALESWLEGRTE